MTRQHPIGHNLGPQLHQLGVAQLRIGGRARRHPRGTRERSTGRPARSPGSLISPTTTCPYSTSSWLRNEALMQLAGLAVPGVAGHASLLHCVDGILQLLNVGCGRGGSVWSACRPTLRRRSGAAWPGGSHSGWWMRHGRAPVRRWNAASGRPGISHRSVRRSPPNTAPTVAARWSSRTSWWWRWSIGTSVCIRHPTMRRSTVARMREVGLLG